MSEEILTLEVQGESCILCHSTNITRKELNTSTDERICWDCGCTWLKSGIIHHYPPDYFNINGRVVYAGVDMAVGVDRRILFDGVRIDRRQFVDSMQELMQELIQELRLTAHKGVLT